jgi:integrase
MLQHPSLKRVEGFYKRTRWPGIFSYHGKHGVKFGIDYYCGGKQKREMVGTMEQAREKLREVHGQIQRGDFVVDRKKFTFDQLKTKYEKIYKGEPYFENSRKYYLKILEDYFGKDRRLYQINLYDLEQFKVKRKATLTQHGKERSGVSVNREMECLRHLFNKAVEWQMMERNPFDRFKNKGSIFFQENGGRTRFLSQDEICRLLEACPEYLGHIVKAGLLCGLRKSDLLGLRWESVDLETGMLTFSEGKKRGRKVSKALCSDMLALLHKIPAKNDGFIFHGPNGEAPLKDISRSFQTALRKAELKDVRFHDLRRTFASHLAMRGVSMRVIQQELGHSSILMTEVYSRLSPEHQKLEVERLNGLCPEVSA